MFALIALTITAAGTLAIPGRDAADRRSRVRRCQCQWRRPARAISDAGSAILFVIVLVIAFGTAARFYFVSWIGERVVADIRRKVQRNLLRLSPSFLRRKQPQGNIEPDDIRYRDHRNRGRHKRFRWHCANMFLGIGGTIYLFWLLPGLTVWLAVGHSRRDPADRVLRPQDPLAFRATDQDRVARCRRDGDSKC